MACGRNKVAILDQLIEAGADVHSRNAKSTPLHQAAGCNFSEGIRKLLLLGADPSQKDWRGRTPDQVAEECGFEESVSVFRTTRPAT
jgi:ankyrin repeat protein